MSLEAILDCRFATIVQQNPKACTFALSLIEKQSDSPPSTNVVDTAFSSFMHFALHCLTPSMQLFVMTKLLDEDLR